MPEPGAPAYLGLDVELQESGIPDGFALPDVGRYRPPAPPSGNPAAIADAAKALREARWPVLLVEGLGRAPGGPEALQSLSELLGIPVIEQGSSFNLSNLHPLNVSGASVEVLKEADLVLTVGVKDIEAALTRPEPEAGIVPAGLPRVPSGYSRRHQSVIREGTKLVRVGLQEYGIRSWTSSHGRLGPAENALLGGGPPVLREVPRLRQSAMGGAVQPRAPP